MDTTPEVKTLEQRLDSSAEAWRPNVGDSVIGIVADIDSRTTEFGTYPIVVLQTASGDEVALHAFHTVLKREFSKRPPRIGERLGVKYLGKSERGYEGYRLVFEEAVAPDWNRMGIEAEAEAVVEGVDEPETDDDPPEPRGDDDIPF